MAKTADQSQVFLYDLDGETVEVAREHRDAFLRENPKARGVGLYEAGGETVEVADGDLDAFRKANPTAERVHLFDQPDGETVEVARKDVPAYIGSRAAPDKDRSWGSYAGEAYADAGRAVAKGARKVAGAVSGAAEVVKDAGKAVGQAVGTVASNAADVARRIPAAAEGFLDRAAVAPALLAGRVADALNPDPLAGPVDVLTGQRGRFSPQEMGYAEDPYRQGLASRTADRARAWLARRDEARAPTTPAGRVADVPVQFGTTLVGYSTPVGPLAMVGNAAAAGDRAYAEGASGAQALGRTALSLGAQAAAFGPKPLPVPGANAAGRAVEGAAARIGGRLAQTPEGAARAVRTAVTAGQVARGAVESGARMAGVTAAEGGDAKDVLIAAGVGGAVGGAVRGLSTRPLARVAGDAAGRMARGGVDTPPPRMDPAGLAANRAEATARTPEGDAALARANAGIASPERAGLPAPAEPGAVPTVYGNRTIVPPYYGPTVSRPGEPIAPPAPYADKVPEPIPETQEEVVRRRKEALDALPLPQRLKKTGFSAYYDQYPDRAGVLDAIGFEKFANLYRKYKGDFRNVTGDLVNADEVGGIVGRDYSGADGVRRALEDGAQEYAGFREWKEQGAPTAEEEMQTGQEVAWNKARNAEAEAEVRRRYELTHPEMTGEPRVTEEEIRAAQAAAEQGEVERIEAEAMQEPELSPAPATPVAGSSTPPREATIAEKAEAVPWDTRDFYSWTANAFHTPEEANEVFGKVIEEMAKREISYAQAAAEVTNYTRYKTDALADRITDLAKAGIQIHQLVEEARAKLPPKEPDTARQAWNAELYRLSDAKAELDRHQPGRKEYKTHLRKYERQTEDILDRMAELSPALKDVLTARRALEQALDAAEKKKAADEEWRAINDLVERARHYQQKAINKGPGVTFEEIEEPGYPLPGRGKAAEREPFALDGGTPAEIDAEKARVAEAQKRAALEEAAAAPGRDLGTVSIQEGLPGIGGDGTLFTPPAGGWSGRVASGPARGDVAAETPRLAGTAAGVKPATPDGPRTAIRSELQVLLDSGEKDPATLEDLARRAEAADAFATAALARQAAGTYRGTPWGTEGGSWPAEEPPAARATVGDLVQLAKAMGDGSAPAVMRRIARHPSWAGVFRGEEGVPESGRIGVITKMARLVDDSQKARIREAAAQKAAETGEDPATVYASMMVRAIRENAAAGPKPLQAVLAHEIGHFLDFLDEGTLKRGNVLGHLAALKKYMARTLFPTKAAADAAGAPGLTAAEVKAAAKEWRVPESEARRRLVEERDLLAHPEIRREMESLVAWFRQTDGAPDYFRNDPAELYAEAFSAWVNYPAETARRAPEFAAALEGWMDARPQAAKALEEFRSGVTQRAARAAVERGDTTDPAFFAAQEREAEAARWWQRRKAAAVANLRPQTARQRVKAFGDALRVSLTGPMNVIRSDLMSSGAGQAFRPENLPLWRAMRQAENAPNLAALWDYRFKAFVEPELEGAPYTAFLNYLKHYRIATELLGKDLDRGRMNLPNPGGVTPGDITRDGVNQATSSAAWIHALKRDQPELYAKLERARKAFWEKVRNGRDDLGGDGSPMQIVRDTPVLSKEQKEQLLGNEGYVSFSEKDLPDPSRRMASEEQSLWDGIFSQRTGTFKEPGDVVANTIRGDYNLMRRIGQMELALRTVDWLRANKPELVGGQAETKRDPVTGRLYVEQGTKPGMRTVSFLRDGKPEGWYVPVAYAEAVEMPGRGERSWDGIMGALSKVKRGLNAMQTSWNPVFNTNNSWAKDPHSLALRLPNWRVRGHGALGGTARALGNVFGHYGEMLGSYLDNSGRDYARGKYNPDTARALAWGAVNNAAPGSTAYADAQGGGVGVLEGRLRDRGLEGQTLDDAARRQILKARGLTEEQIDAGLRSAEGTLEKWAKAWDSMGSLARGARLLYPRILSQLQHGEIRTKSYALKRILAERPDLSREEAVEIARQQIGTPDMANKPAIDRSPLLGATLFQYFTPRVHGWVDQLVGAMRRGWTGGTKEQATKFTRLVALTAAMSVPFFILRDAIQTYRHSEEEEGKARARGDLDAAERFAEEKEKARARARSIQAISSRDLFTKVFAFAGDGRALGFSVDPTVTPITTAVLGSLFGREWGVKPGDALREGVGTEILPGFAPLFTAAWGNLRGFDPNTGRELPGGKDAGFWNLDNLAWTAETLTGRSLGTSAISAARELVAPKDDARSEERRSRQDVPILSAAWRPFWRKTGYGLVERAAAMREEQKQVNALVGAIAERYARGQPVSEEDARWFAQHAAQPGESVRAAAERVWKLRNMTPDQRAADSLSRRSRREIEEEFGYVPPPPRLTDEDRAR